MLRKGECKHYAGLRAGTCEAGVCYRDVTPEPDAPGIIYRLPCIQEHGPGLAKLAESSKDKKGTCPKYEEPTPEEIKAAEKADEEMMAAAVARAEKIAPAIAELRREAGPKGQRRSLVKDFDPCPACGTGKLRLSIAGYNGHIHGRCTTAGCISFMQ